MSDLQMVDEQLSLKEQFRLIEIAHETRHPEIRDAALRLLQPSIILVVPKPPHET